MAGLVADAGVDDRDAERADLAAVVAAVVVVQRRAGVAAGREREPQLAARHARAGRDRGRAVAVAAGGVERGLNGAALGGAVAERPRAELQRAPRRAHDVVEEAVDRLAVGRDGRRAEAVAGRRHQAHGRLVGQPRDEAGGAVGGVDDGDGQHEHGERGGEPADRLRRAAARDAAPDPPQAERGDHGRQVAGVDDAKKRASARCRPPAAPSANGLSVNAQSSSVSTPRTANSSASQSMSSRL